MKIDVLIIGGGAAGLMCATEAAKRGRRTVVIEHTDAPGGKILISGGGRCNFTNRKVSVDNYVSQNSKFCISALSRYTPEDFITLVKKYQIAFHEKTLGQLFCDHSAKNILNILLDECRMAGVTLLTQTTIKTIEKADDYCTTTDRHRIFSQSLVIATGGLSIPQMGASDFGYRVAEQFGVKVTKRDPALVGFVLDEKQETVCTALAGVSARVTMRCENTLFTENVLFTHQGLSGPAALQTSLYWHEHQPVMINYFPDFTASALEQWFLNKKRLLSLKNITTILSEFLSERLAHLLCQQFFQAPIKVHDIPDASLRRFAKYVQHWQIIPKSTVGYKKAEVTRGGVDTRELSAKTMQTHKIPGLFFIGEVVDVTGWLGGYNFQWAWSSGFVCGQHA